MSFSEQAEAFRAFLRTVPQTAAADGGCRVAVPVVPWIETAVPWYSIALALLERARGFHPVLIFDDLPPPNPAEPPGQLEVIAAVLATLDETLEVRPLSTLPPGAPRPGDVALLERATERNLPYLERSSVGDPASIAHLHRALADRLGRVRALLAEGGWDHLLLPGGIYSVSTLFRELGAQARVRTPCYDSGPGAMTLGTDHIAGHCRDLGRIFDPPHAGFVAQHRTQAIELAKKEFALRTQSLDRRAFQVAAYRSGVEAEAPGEVVLPMNVFDDSAAIGRSQLFAGPREWVEETTAFVLEKTEAALVVREHPGMRWLGRKDFIGSPLRERFGAHPRFRFVGARDEVSTYQLLENARVVLPWVSTVGVEAALLGKRVILETDAWYAHLPFVERATSRDDYFTLIRAALTAPEPLSEALREQAWLSYFFSQVANFVITDFTPQPVDFARWVRRDFASLAADPQVEIIVRVLAEGTPSWRLQSERILSGTTPPASSPRPSPKTLWQRVQRACGKAS